MVCLCKLMLVQNITTVCESRSLDETFILRVTSLIKELIKCMTTSNTHDYFSSLKFFFSKRETNNIRTSFILLVRYLDLWHNFAALEDTLTDRYHIELLNWCNGLRVSCCNVSFCFESQRYLFITCIAAPITIAAFDICIILLFSGLICYHLNNKVVCFICDAFMVNIIIISISSGSSGGSSRTSTSSSLSIVK